MIRAAKFTDITAMKTLIRRQYEQSKYFGRLEISEKALEQVMLGLVAGQTQHGPQATHVSVWAEDQKVVGFIAGSLARIYNVTTRLSSSDLFLINEGSPKGTFALVDAYVAWAKANPKVLMVGLSWTDALPGGERLAKLYEMKGFEKVGELFEMRLDIAEEREAA